MSHAIRVSNKSINKASLCVGLVCFLAKMLRVKLNQEAAASGSCHSIRLTAPLSQYLHLTGLSHLPLEVDNILSLDDCAMFAALTRLLNQTI